MKTKITYRIGLKASTGSYKAFVKEFNDDKHYQNWYKLVTSKGATVVGVEQVN